ncbi:MAG: S8 family serine peptidase, partial [Cloacibacillus sp.]
MRKFEIIKRTCLVAALLLFVFGAAAQAAEYAEGEALVVLRGSMSVNRFNAGDAAAQQRSIAARVKQAAPSGVDTVEGYNVLTAKSEKTFAHVKSDSMTTEELMKKLSSAPDVVAVFPNYIRQNSAIDYCLNLGLQDNWNMSNLFTAWTKYRVTGNANILAAVVDTGVKYDHHDLVDNIASISGLTGSYAAYNNAAGAWFSQNGASKYTVSGVSGGTFLPTYDQLKLDGKASANWRDWRQFGDLAGHGTHVAGIVGAVGANSIGIAGVNWRVKLLPVNIFTLKSDLSELVGAYDSDTISAMQYLLEVQKNSNYKGRLKVVNLSVGSWNPRAINYKASNPYVQAIKALGDAGVTVCIAAGNESQNINAPTGQYLGKLPFPAAFGTLPGISNVIVVGAAEYNTAGRIQRASYSNYSNPSKADKARYVDIFAPGTNILSTVPRYLPKGVCRSGVLSDSSDGHYAGYGYMSGTSMAAPMASGAVALLYANYPSYSHKQIMNLLFSSANGACLGKGYSTYGLMNIDAAIRRGGSVPVKPPATAAAKISAKALASFAAPELDFDVSEYMTRLGLSANYQYDKEDDAFYLSDDMAFDIADAMTESEDEYAEMEISEPLPVFALSSDTQAPFASGDIVESVFEIDGFWLGDDVSSLRLYRGPGANGNAALSLDYVESGDIDGTFCLAADGHPLASTELIEPDKTYELRIRVKDNGKYDLDDAEGRILNAMALYTIVPSQDEEADI